MSKRRIPAAVKGSICVTVEVVPQQHWLFKHLSTVGRITDESLESLLAAASFHVVLKKSVPLELPGAVGAGWLSVAFGAIINLLLTGDAVQEHVKGRLKLLATVPACHLFLFPAAVLMLLQLDHI